MTTRPLALLFSSIARGILSYLLCPAERVEHNKQERSKLFSLAGGAAGRKKVWRQRSRRRRAMETSPTKNPKKTARFARLPNPDLFLESARMIRAMNLLLVSFGQLRVLVRFRNVLQIIKSYGKKFSGNIYIQAHMQG